MKFPSPAKDPGPKLRTDHPLTLFAPPEKYLFSKGTTLAFP